LTLYNNLKEDLQNPYYIFRCKPACRQAGRKVKAGTIFFFVLTLYDNLKEDLENPFQPSV
jgi:hypothetical protein